MIFFVFFFFFNYIKLIPKNAVFFLEDKKTSINVITFFYFFIFKNTNHRIVEGKPFEKRNSNLSRRSILLFSVFFQFLFPSGNEFSPSITRTYIQNEIHFI